VPKFCFVKRARVFKIFGRAAHYKESIDGSDKTAQAAVIWKYVFPFFFFVSMISGAFYSINTSGLSVVGYR
jgi:hypothetical protein